MKMSLLAMILLPVSVWAAPTHFKCTVTESLGTSKVNELYTVQNTTEMEFVLGEYGDSTFASTLFPGISFDFSVSTGTVGSEKMTTTYFKFLDEVAGVDSLELIFIANSPVDNSTPTTSWWRFYTRANQDSVSIMCDTNP